MKRLKKVSSGVLSVLLFSALAPMSAYATAEGDEDSETVVSSENQEVSLYEVTETEEDAASFTDTAQRESESASATTVEPSDEAAETNEVISFAEALYTVTYAPGKHGSFEAQVYSGLRDGTVSPHYYGSPTGQTGWVFAGWDAELSDTVREDTTYTALWTEKEKGYFEYVVKSPSPKAWSSLSYTSSQGGYQIKVVAQANPEGDMELAITLHELGKESAAVVMPAVQIPDDAPLGTTSWTEVSLKGYHLSLMLERTRLRDQIMMIDYVYPVTYDLRYLSGEHGTFSAQYYDDIPVGDIVPAFVGEPTGETGWEFDGWNAKLANTMTDNMTYTAQWRAIPVTIAPDDNNDSIGNDTEDTENAVENDTEDTTENSTGNDANDTTKDGVENAINEEASDIVDDDTVDNSAASVIPAVLATLGFDTITGGIAVENEATSILPEETPLTASSDKSVQAETVVADNDTPLGNASVTAAWALVNLALAVSSLIIGFFAAILLFARNKKRNGAKKRNGHANLAWCSVGVLFGIMSPIAFLFTENMRNHMVMVDKWTLLMAVFLFLQIVGMFVLRYAFDKEEGERKIPMTV